MRYVSLSAIGDAVSSNCPNTFNFRLFGKGFWLCLILTAAVCLHLPAGASAALNLTAEERSWLNSNPDKLVLWFNTEFPPIEFISENGEFTGMGADVIALVEQELGVEFIKQPSEDWNEHLAALKSGACAVAPTIVATEERKRYAEFTTPYESAPVVIITGNQIQESLELSNLEGMRVAVVSGYASEEYLRKQPNLDIKMIPMPDVVHALRATSFGQVDAYLENIAVAGYYIEKEGIANLHVAGATDYSFAWSIGISGKYPLLASAVKKAMASIPSKDLESVRRRWIFLDIDPKWSGETLRLFAILSGFAVLLAAGLFVIAYVLKMRLQEKITSLDEAHKKISEQAKMLRIAAEAAQAGMWDFHVQERLSFLSTQWFSMLGYSRNAEELSFEDFQDFIHPEDLPGFTNHFRDYIDGGGRSLLEYEARFKQADGSWRWVLSKGRAVERDERGRPTRIIGLNVNIQTVKDAQEKVKQSEAKFRAIFDNAPYAIVINNLEDGKLVDANKAFFVNRGLSGPEDFANIPPNGFSTMSREEVQAIINQLAKTGKLDGYETELVNVDGSRGHIVFSSVVMEVAGRKQVLSMVVDITDRKQAEMQLRQSEEKFSKIFSMAPFLIAISRLDDETILDVNNSFAEVTGWKRREIVGQNASDINFWADPATREEMIHEIMQGRDVLNREMDFCCRNGEIRSGLYSARAIQLSEGWAFLFVMQDITEHKKLEKEQQRLQSQLLQAQKMEAVGTLAGGVAHDFNNMIGAIIGFAQLAMNKMDQSHPLHETFSQILDCSFRSASLTRQLLAFARKEIVEPMILDINTAVEELLKMLQRLISENIKLHWTPGPGPLIVKLDPSQLDQVLANLCVNARDAIADIGDITIKTQLQVFDEQTSLIHPDCLPGEYVMIAVSDTGCGIEEKTLAHIFEPFFTTKPQGRGTGLGLATVYGIARQNSGFVKVYSEPGKGATFKVYFPRYTREENQVKKEEKAISQSRGETILLVEDDAILLKMTTNMLLHLGYKVIATGSPSEALRLAEISEEEIHLFLTDVIMPDMGGRSLADAVDKIRPGIKILYMSGYTTNAIVHQGVMEKGVNFIQKPFSLQSLAQKIRTMLD
ncbi:PAS domain S-box protein [Desulfatibacillum aliphaticivorans]|uniref:PAS domain S-box protein n=1 Tax=Desulfatibacillum aliphaticivorans TaxID=218208 RepID=UPI0004094A4E|nr:PAS domain S-box protein [Desulfatibacillum aliphaticivorans]